MPAHLYAWTTVLKNQICFLFSLLAGRGRGLLHCLWSFLPHPLHFTWFYKTADKGGVDKGSK